MRLPFDKPYRAFPEFDRFTDAECEQFVKSARTRNSLQATAFGCLNLIISLGGLILLGGLGMSIGGRLMRNYDNIPRFLLGLLIVTLFVGAGPIAGLLVRDFWLRRAMRALIADAACDSCRYSLLGLVATDGVVRCPECGHTTDLSRRDLTAAQLLAPEPPP